MEAAEEVNAKKQTLKENDALKLAAAAAELYVAKGKKIVHINMKKDKPTKEELKKLIVGPTGNLRAPTLKVGKKLVVGFNDEMYSHVFK